jgi:hypothetical protein
MAKNIYELAIGPTKHFVAAEDEQDAYDQGTDPEKFPDMHFLPFQITKVEIPGHTINVTSDEPEQIVTRRGRKPASA